MLFGSVYKLQWILSKGATIAVVLPAITRSRALHDLIDLEETSSYLIVVCLSAFLLELLELLDFIVRDI